jgi:hypothetical protein
MSQLDFLRSTVSDFFDDLIGSDIADSGTYTNPSGKGTFPIRVLIRRGVNPFGDFGKVNGQDFELRFPTADVSAGRGGTVQMTSIANGTETFKLVENLADTGAVSTWRAIRV